MSQEASGSPKFSYASGANATFIDQLFNQYKSDPNSVDESWQKFFEGYEFAAIGDASNNVDSASVAEARDSARVEALINAYRRLGHLYSKTNPLADSPPDKSELSAANHSLDHIDDKHVFFPSNLPQTSMAFSEIINLLDETYCGHIGADFREMNTIEAVTWFQEKMENVRNKPVFSTEDQRRIYQKLAEAEGFDQFLGKRYIGQKRFSLEGADTLIPMMDILISEAAKASAEEVCIGMAHRGRLSILANIMGKSYERMLLEFEGSEYNAFDIDGDVKYHKGLASEVETPDGNKIRLYLNPNPSHLEFVNPVCEGFVRARQELSKDQERTKNIPILIHGDAAFMGQGIVAETLNLSGLKQYETGGTIHIIINNQVGFTTEPHDSRSGPYSSDISKIIRAPVLHVNADDAEAVAWCAQLAVAYRQKFKHDIVIDLIGYRRHGHNEGDEPAFTQPLMYEKIAKHPTALTKYTEQLVNSGAFSEAECKSIKKTFRDKMQEAYEKVHGKKAPNAPKPPIPNSLQKIFDYKKVSRVEVDQTYETKVDKETLLKIADTITAIPDDFNINKKLERLVQTRRQMVGPDGKIDWGFGELLAIGSILMDRRHIRFTGQDVCRGTFTSRHAIFFDSKTAQPLNLFDKLDDEGVGIHFINSPLSEQGCLGFEFGYSIGAPDSLVIWEAQFGDFANGAQIIIDQFISASEAKWKQTSNLVMLLPHGHEGQGPEHSSARPERFLQLCGNLNMQVVIPTTPAQHFHALRRQICRDFRKPLVIMSPKSLLRHPECYSNISDLSEGCFNEVIDDESTKSPTKVKRIIACSGKIYYELKKHRGENPDFSQIPIVRVEQLYPFPYKHLEGILKKYKNLEEIVWVQEEPQNMGGWNFVRGRFSDILKEKHSLSYVGRKNSGTPAEGSGKAHETEQKRILEAAFSKAGGWSTDSNK